MKAIIFGINSQDGQYLRQLLENKRVEVLGVSRSIGNWHQGDISDYKTVEEIIKFNKPDFIFHLAAKSSTKHETIFENHKTISLGTLNILESVKIHSRNSKVFIAGSGVQFMNLGRPIKETDDFEASSPYSIARIQSVYAARYYRSIGIRSYVGYLFHHESPLRKHHHVSKMIAELILKIKNGSDDKITLGDLNVMKEWAFAKDITEGIFTLVNQNEVFESTIGTGVAFSIEDYLKVCFKIVNKNWKDYVIRGDSNFKAEYKVLVSDPSTINKLGWSATTSFEELARIMIENNKFDTLSHCG